MNTIPIESPPQKMRDPIGQEEERATWIFCKAFPLEKLLEGSTRACRYGWRNRGYNLIDSEGKEIPEEVDEIWPMLSVGSDGDSENPQLVFQKEYADEFGDGYFFSSINDMLAEDWYLEDPQR